MKVNEKIETMETRLDRKTVVEMITMGFAGIFGAMLRGAERGETTDVAGLLDRLRALILDRCGYDYDRAALRSMFEGWLYLQRT